MVGVGIEKLEEPKPESKDQPANTQNPPKIDAKGRPQPEPKKKSLGLVLAPAKKARNKSRSRRTRSNQNHRFSQNPKRLQ
jgi:hypothetical protein